MCRFTATNIGATIVGLSHHDMMAAARDSSVGRDFMNTDFTELRCAIMSKRRAQGLSARTLAGQIHISFSALSRFERGGGITPHTENRLRVWLGEQPANACGCQRCIAQPIDIIWSRIASRVKQLIMEELLHGKETRESLEEAAPVEITPSPQSVISDE